jgi:hypothetical protein
MIVSQRSLMSSKFLFWAGVDYTRSEAGKFSDLIPRPPQTSAFARTASRVSLVQDGMLMVATKNKNGWRSEVDERGRGSSPKPCSGFPGQARAPRIADFILDDDRLKRGTPRCCRPLFLQSIAFSAFASPPRLL